MCRHRHVSFAKVSHKTFAKEFIKISRNKEVRAWGYFHEYTFIRRTLGWQVMGKGRRDEL